MIIGRLPYHMALLRANVAKLKNLGVGNLAPAALGLNTPLVQVNGIQMGLPLTQSKADADYVVAATDAGSILRFGTLTANRTISTNVAASSFGNGFIFGLVNDTAADFIAIFDPNGAETVNVAGNLTLRIPSGFGVWLRTDGTNWFTMGTIIGPGIPIDRLIASASATLNLSLASVPANAAAVEIVIEDTIPSTNAVDQWLRTSSDGGATYDLGAASYEYSGSIISTGGAANVVSVGAIQILITSGNQPNAFSNIRANYHIRIDRPKRGNRPMLIIHGEFRTTVSTNESFWMRAARLLDHSIDGVQTLYSAGNITSGAMYGWWN